MNLPRAGQPRAGRSAMAGPPGRAAGGSSIAGTPRKSAGGSSIAGTPGRSLSTLIAVLLAAIVGGAGLSRWEAGLLPYRQTPSLAIVARGPGRAQADLLQGVTTPLERRFRSLVGVAAVASETTDGLCRFELQTVRETDPGRLRVAVRDVLDSLPDLGIEDVSVAVTAGEALPAIELAIVRSAGGPSGTGGGRNSGFQSGSAGGAAAHEEIEAAGTDGAGVPGGGADGERSMFVARILRPELAAVAGVERVEVLGLEIPHAVVTPLAASLALRGLSAADVAARLSVVGQSVQAGRAREGGNLRPLVVRETVSSIEQLGALRLKTPNGDAALRDVARISVRAIGDGTWFRADGADGTLVRIFRVPGVDDAALSRRVRQRIGHVAARLPAGLRLRWVVDRGAGARRSLFALAAALTAGLLLGAVPLRWLLGTWSRAALLLSLLPLVLLLASAALLLAGTAPDLLALAALAASAGLLLADLLAAWQWASAESPARDGAELGDPLAGERSAPPDLPARDGAGLADPRARERSAPPESAARTNAEGEWDLRGAEPLAPVIAHAAAGVLTAAVVLALAVYGAGLQPWLTAAAVTLVAALAAGAVVALTVVPILAKPYRPSGSSAASGTGRSGISGVSETGNSAISRTSESSGTSAISRTSESSESSETSGIYGIYEIGSSGASGISEASGSSGISGISKSAGTSGISGARRSAEWRFGAAYRQFLERGLRRPGRVLVAGAAGLLLLMAGALLTSRGLVRIAPASTVELDYRLAGGLAPAVAEARGRALDDAVRRAVAALGASVLSRSASAGRGRGPRNAAADPENPEETADRALMDPGMGGRISLALAAPGDPGRVRQLRRRLHDSLQAGPDVRVFERPPEAAPAALADLDEPLRVYGAPASLAPGGSLRRELAAACITAAGSGEAAGPAAGDRAELRLSWRGNALAGSPADLPDLDEQVRASLGDFEAGKVEIPGLAPQVHVDPVTPRDLLALPLRVAAGSGVAAGYSSSDGYGSPAGSGAPAGPGLPASSGGPAAGGALGAALVDPPASLAASYLPLAALGSVAAGQAPQPVWRLDGRPALALRCQAGAAPTVARILADPASYGYVSGAALRLPPELAPRLALAAAGAGALILLGLMALYNSAAVACAVAGAAAAPVACALAAVGGMPRALWVPAVLGLLVAAAVAIRPGLLVAARAEQLRGDGREPYAAVVLAAQELHRPLLATTVLGWLLLLPLLVMGGDVGRLSRPLVLTVGWAGAGGLLAGLILAPALYLALHLALRTGPPDS